MKQVFKKLCTKEFLSYASDCIKYFIMVCFMTAGIWFLFTMLWDAAGLPLEDWAFFVTFALAGLCERLWLWWVGNT